MIKIDEKLYKEAINMVAATDAGKIVIATLKDACNWDTTLVSSEDPQVTQFYAAQRGVYGSLRKHINREYLKEIEFNYMRKPHDNGTRDTNKRITKPSDRSSSRSKPTNK